MSSRIENLGDYNKVRIDLQNAGGNLDILYGKIGATAVAKAAPALLVAGAGIFYISQKGVQLFKKRKEMIKNEPELKKQFKEALKCLMKKICDTRMMGKLDIMNICQNCYSI